jgi:hypothetical protein
MGYAQRITLYEKLHENPVLASGGSRLRDGVCGGQAEVCKDRQELPDER